MEKEKGFVKDLLEVVIGALILTFIILKFLMMPVVVDGSSMEHTLEDGDYGFSFILSRNIGIRRFDIAVVDPKIKGDEKLLVKRVIGLPLETVEFKDNVLYINGQQIEEDFLGEVWTSDFSIELGEDEYFCMGDNRGVSKDSRFYGPFSKDQLLATHILTLWPLNHFGVK